MKFYEDCIRVLNVMALKNDSKLTTDICTKNTGNHQILHAQSCRRNIYRKSIPYKESVRSRTFNITSLIRFKRTRSDVDAISSCFLKRGC